MILPASSTTKIVRRPRRNQSKLLRWKRTVRYPCAHNKSQSSRHFTKGVAPSRETPPARTPQLKVSLVLWRFAKSRALSSLRYRGRSVVLGGLSIKGRKPSQPCAIKSQAVLSTSLEACAACSNASSAYCLYSSPCAWTSTSVIAISRIRESHKKRDSFSVSLRLIAVIVTGRAPLSCGEAYADAASRSPS